MGRNGYACSEHLFLCWETGCSPRHRVCSAPLGVSVVCTHHPATWDLIFPLWQTILQTLHSKEKHPERGGFYRWDFLNVWYARFLFIVDREQTPSMWHPFCLTFYLPSVHSSRQKLSCPNLQPASCIPGVVSGLVWEPDAISGLKTFVLNCPHSSIGF